VIDKYIQDALVIWTTIDPIGTLAIFVSQTAHLSDAERRRVAFRVVAYAASVLLGAILVGQIILNGLGIRMVSFQFAGGIILFLFGLQMIFGVQTSRLRSEPDHDVAVFPLAIPATATPGAILAVILLTDNHIFPVAVQIGTALVTTSILLVTLLILLFSGRIIAVIGMNGASILTKIMGMILAALSVELAMNALGVEQWLGKAP
jgi:multiple antibiotic resistance protein